MNASSFPKNARQVEELAARIRAEIVGAFDRHDADFQRSGGDVRGVRIQAPSLAGIPVNVAESLGIDFGQRVTQPLRNSRTCEATLDTNGHAFTGGLVVSNYQSA